MNNFPSYTSNETINYEQCIGYMVCKTVGKILYVSIIDWSVLEIIFFNKMP